MHILNLVILMLLAKIAKISCRSSSFKVCSSCIELRS